MKLRAGLGLSVVSFVLLLSVFSFAAAQGTGSDSGTGATSGTGSNSGTGATSGTGGTTTTGSTTTGSTSGTGSHDDDDDDDDNNHGKGSWVKRLKDEYKKDRKIVAEKAKELTREIKENRKEVRDERKDYQKERKPWVYYVGTADVSGVNKIVQDFNAEHQALVKTYTDKIKSGTGSTGDIQTILSQWKTATLDLVTRKWAAIRPFVDADKLSAFESLLAARKALIEEAFAARSENASLRQEKKSLRASLMVKNAEKLWNKAKKGSDSMKKRFTKNMERLTSQIDKILAKSNVKAEDRTMWEGVKAKLLAYDGTVGGSSSVSPEYLHDLIKQLQNALGN